MIIFSNSVYASRDKSRTAEKEGSSSLGVGRGGNNSLPYKINHVTKYCKTLRNQTDLSVRPKHLEDPGVDGRTVLRWIFEGLGGGGGHRLGRSGRLL